MATNHKMELPVEGMLSLMAIFVLMPIIFVIANSKPAQPAVTRAANENMESETPMPEDSVESEVYNIYN